VSQSDSRRFSAKTEAILEGALQEFLSHGYAATSMDRVAARASVSKATIYSHFRDKADLFAAIMQRLATHKLNQIFEPGVVLQGDPRTVLRTLAMKMCQQAQQDDRFCEFMRLMIGESGRFPELAQPYLNNMARPAIAALSSYLAAELALNDPEAVARTFIGAMVYFIMLQEVLHGKESLPICQERMVETLVELIAP
jgi:AcrR family transcriptional regulator